MNSSSGPDPLGLVGRTVSHFDVRELIGVGGMGVVYRAEDTQLGRPVALKFLAPAYSLDATAKARFLREAHSAAALNHPNLCMIHEVGTSDDRRLFLAMALYQGETLKARLARGDPMPVREILDIARQIAEGLQAAHAAGIVHRDLKPGNVMLLPDGSVRILDFGLAKMRDQSLSEAGARLGTVSYMAPEQIRGERVDGRADLWTLGVVLYEILTGRMPFAGEQDIAVFHAILHDEPVPPSTHRTDVTAALEDVVVKLLQKDPARRYAAAADVLGSLARAGEPAGGLRHPLRRLLRRARQSLSTTRPRILSAGAAIVMIGTAAYAAIARNGATPPAGTPTRMAIAVLPFRNLSADSSHAYVASGLQEEILTQLYRVPALKVIGRSSVMGYRGSGRRPIRQIATELGVGSVVDASVRIVGSRVHVTVQVVDGVTEVPIWVERYDRRLDEAFALQSEIARQILATVGAALSSRQRDAWGRVSTTKADAYLLYLRAREHDRRGANGVVWNLDTMITLYEQALALDPDFALAHAAVSTKHGDMYVMAHDMTPERLARQRAAAEAALRLAPDLPEAHAAMADVYLTGPNRDMAGYLREAQSALRLAPNDPGLLGRLAFFYRRAGDWAKCLAAAEKVVELDPRNPVGLEFLAETYARLGRHADAIQGYNRVIGVGPEGALFYEILIGWLYADWQGQLDILRAAMNGAPGQLMLRYGWIWQHARFLFVERQPDSLLKVLKWFRDETSHVGWSVLDYSYVELHSGWAHQLRGDRVAARTAFQRALVLLDSAIVRRPHDWSLHGARGLALAGLGLPDAALREARWLRDSPIHRDDHMSGPGLRLDEVRILVHAGESDQAVDRLEQLLSEEFTPFTVHFLRYSPHFDRIRNHPRFKPLLIKYAKRS